ncbi:MAG: DUF1553 domain-containing protein [Verrucomicrobiales bacterium]|nr:DUF1553 domain-containing protein [Verrucomicrobiales bacterium]
MRNRTDILGAILCPILFIAFQPNVEAEEKFSISEEDRNYWAFQPVSTTNHENSSIDSIVDEAITTNGWVQNSAADRKVLIRRAYFDLIGLAPTYQEIKAFEADPSSTEKALSSLVDKLLAMPEYGERWGRHWLDVVRYAQTNGYERDDEKPNAWRYRDYVIKAFNTDKPYDRFVLEQLAGDELILEAFNKNKPFLEGGDEGLIATGFYRLGVWDDEPDDKKAAEYDGLDDILRTTTETFLGLTTGCARCHDHMFDPISQKDYYSMLAYFRNVRNYAKPSDKGIILRAINGGKALSVSEHGDEAPETHVLIRGDASKPGLKVKPMIPGIFSAIGPEPEPTENSSGRRLALAKWITDPSNPLTSRVMVNRIWQYHFGKGIVGSPNDFGRAGEPISNLELLDWLATEFVQSGWSIKHMHRVIMNTRAYRRSSDPNVDNEVKDPGNVHHWKMNLRRLEAETIRDRILQMSDQLNQKREGPSFYPALNGEVVAGASKPGRGWQWSSEEDQKRRSVYAFVKRTMVYPFFELFDYANTEGSLGTRPQTTVAPQALLMLNSELNAESATLISKRAISSKDPVGEAFRIVLGRDPITAERSMAKSFLSNQHEKQKPLKGQMRFSPDYSSAYFNEYYKILPSKQFLKGPASGWDYFKGKWTGGYEGILRAERDWPAFALFRWDSKDFKISGQMHLDDITERVSILLRARPRGDEFDGYAAIIDAVSNEIILKRYQKGKSEILVKASAGDLRRGFLDFTVELIENRIGFKIFGPVGFDAVKIYTKDEEPIEGLGRFGVSSWGGNVTFDHLSIEHKEKKYPIMQIDHSGSELIKNNKKILLKEDPTIIQRRAMAEFCSLLLNLNEFVYVD